jgi:Zn-dependent oligopeptidase
MALTKVKKLIDAISEERKPVAESLLKELSFMERTLSELKKTVQEVGAVEHFENGKQKFVRENPALKSYNTTIQRYALIYKQFVDLLPVAVKPEAKDDLMVFMGKK